MITITPIGPKDWGKIIPVDAVEKAIQLALDLSAEGVITDFQVTTKTWNHKPTFQISKPTPYSRRVWTDDKIYGYTNWGTKRHSIIAHGKALAIRLGSSPKTKPNGRVQSYVGRKGKNVIFRRRVNHPGTSPRRFDAIIRRKWEKQFPNQLRRAISAAIKTRRV